MNYKKLVDDFRENERNFDKIYNAFYGKLKFFVFGYVKDFDDIEDIVSLTFAKAYINFHKYDDTLSEFNTWLYSIARNESLTCLKRKSCIVSIDSQMTSDGENSSTHAEMLESTIDDEIEEKENKVQTLVNKLFEFIGKDTVHGKILEYRYIQSMSNKQILNTLNKEKIERYNELSKQMNLYKNTHIYFTKAKERDDVEKEFINENFVKTSLNKTEKILKDNFKDINIYDFIE